MKLAVIGDPVEHSRSPQLHEQFMREAGIDGSYVAIRVSIEGCARTIARLRADGFTGCNVTYPLKEEAARSCGRLTQEAELAGCVNTMLFGREIARNEHRRYRRALSARSASSTNPSRSNASAF